MTIASENDRNFGKYRDEVMSRVLLLRDPLRLPLYLLNNKGETRLMRFREVFVQQMTQMAAALLVPAAAALVLSLILSSIFVLKKLNSLVWKIRHGLW